MEQAFAVDSPAVDRRVWLDCAPPLTRLPEVGGLAYYFPRGHAAQCEDGVAPTGEIAAEKVLCLVGAVELLVRGDDVFSRIRLLPQPKQPGQPRSDDASVFTDDVRDAFVRRGSFVCREGEIPVDDALDAHVHRDVCDAFVRREGRSPVDKVRGAKLLVDEVQDVCDAFVRREGRSPVDKVRGAKLLVDEGELRVCDAFVRREDEGKLPVGDAFVRRDDMSPMDEHHAKLLIDNFGHAFVRSDLPVEDVLDTLGRHDAKLADDISGYIRDDGHGMVRDALVLSNDGRGPSPKDNARRDALVRSNDGRGPSPKDNARRDEEQDPFDGGDRKHDTRDNSGFDRDGFVGTNPTDRVGIPSGVPVDIPSYVQDALVQAGRGLQAAANGDVLLVFPKALTLREITINRQATFNVPKECGTRILPLMPDVAVQGKANQSVTLTDLGGQVFQFTHSRYIGRNGRQQHKFTSGWNHYLETKTPKEGDLLLFIRSGSDLHVALQRKAMPEAFVSPDEIADAARLAEEGGAFTVTWCPRRGAEFVVPRAEVDQALAMEWKVGMRVSCRTGVVKTGVIHEHLPYKIVSKDGTVKNVRDDDWQKLFVDWDDDRAGSAAPCFRLFGVDICP